MTGLTEAVALLKHLAPRITLGDGKHLGWVLLDLDTCTIEWGGSDPLTRRAHATRRLTLEASEARDR